MRTRLIVFSIITVTIVLAGCTTTEPKPTSGVVAFRKDFPVGSVAPDIPFVSMDGKQKTFRRVRQPISIIAFAETPGSACCRLIPELVTLADRFKGKAITVAQISLPTGKCSHGPNCTERCNINDAHLVSLCDTDRIAWTAYYKPENNTVFLIDDDGKITSISTIENIQSIAEEASKLEAEYQEEQERMHENG